MPGSRPCEPGCGCRKHDPAAQSRPCPQGCACGRHNRPKTFDEAAYQAEYRASHRDKARATTKRWKDAHPGRVRVFNQDPAYRAKYMYGSADIWIRLFEEQNGCCRYCREPLDLEKKRAIHIDHDHSCCRGARSCGDCVRGLVCEACNKGIGYFRDDPERMRRVAAELEVANAEVAARKATSPVQEELPINVVRLERREESA